MIEKLKLLLQEAPPAMAFEITEAGIAAARIGTRAELDFLPLLWSAYPFHPHHPRGSAWVSRPGCRRVWTSAGSRA